VTCGHASNDGLLDVGRHLPVVDAHASLVVEVEGVAVVHLLLEETLDLLDAAFVRALGLHDLEEQRHVERDHGDGRAGLGDDRLVDGHEGAAAMQLHQVVDLAAGAFEVLLGLADGAVLIDRPGHLRSDVGVGDRLAAFLEDAGAVEGVHPELPVLAAHDLDRLGDVVGRSGLQGDLVHDLLVGVEVLGVEGRTGRLEDGLIGHAIGSGSARGGEGVDDEVDLAAGHLGLDRLR